MKDVDILKQFLNEETVKKICIELGGCLLYIPKRFYSDEDIIKDYMNNLSIKDVQKKYNLSYTKAYNVFRKYLEIKRDKVEDDTNNANDINCN